MYCRNIFLSAVFILFHAAAASAQLHGTLQKGKHPVGFKIINTTGKDGKAFRLCTWYPAKKNGPSMKLSDYAEISSIGGSQDKNALRNELKNTLKLIFETELASTSQTDFDKALTAEVWAQMDAEMSPGKWPLIISDTEPVSLAATMEWLASQGFVVAVPAIMYGPPADDKTLYTGPTAGLESLLNYMVQQPYVDGNNVSALGFGGGAMASFYLAMKSPVIKCLANIEGGLFMPMSKVTLSPDYAPAKFTIPLLHIVNMHIMNGEAATELDAIKSTKYRLNEQVSLQHHDFTIYGRILNGLMNLRGGEAQLANFVFSELHEQILYFFKNKVPDRSRLKEGGYFKLEIF